MCVGLVVCRALGFKERALETMGAGPEGILAGAMVLVRRSIVVPMCWCPGVGLEFTRCAARCWAWVAAYLKLIFDLKRRFDGVWFVFNKDKIKVETGSKHI